MKKNIGILAALAWAVISLSSASQSSANSFARSPWADAVRSAAQVSSKAKNYAKNADCGGLELVGQSNRLAEMSGSAVLIQSSLNDIKLLASTVQRPNGVESLNGADEARRLINTYHAEVVDAVSQRIGRCTMDHGVEH